MKRVSWVVMTAVLLGALVAGSAGDGEPRTNAERVRAIGETIKCPTCRSQSVAESDAPAAKGIRLEIARRVDAGQTDAEIRDYIAGQAGEDLLLTPSRRGLTGLVWGLPVAALVLAVAGLAAAFSRWRAHAPTAATSEDVALVEQALGKR
jgi:cytochrome c-type biogenesis protein CcmH